VILLCYVGITLVRNIFFNDSFVSYSVPSPILNYLQLYNKFLDHVLKQILPTGVEVPSSFETIVKYLVV